MSFIVSRAMKDKLAARAVRLCAVGTCSLAVVIMIVLAAKSWPLLSSVRLLDLVVSDEWRPLAGRFGFRAFIIGTLLVTAGAGAIAVPISVLCALYLAEYCSPRFRAAVAPVMDLMAAIPSVVYGMWGILAVVPAVRFIARLCGSPSSGYSVLAASCVLAVMIIPYMAHLCLELFMGVPRGMIEASLSLGAGRWRTVKHVILRRTLPGIGAAVGLALCRALGETMAVLMVAGNVPMIPASLFDPVYPLPALIANSYGEMMSVRKYEAALMFAALLLLALMLSLSLASRRPFLRIERSVD